MDTFSAFLRGQAAAATGARTRAFDWTKAAQYLKEHSIKDAEAGLLEDLDWTQGTILSDGVPCLEHGPFLCSNWATPVLICNDETLECWHYSETQNASELWPPVALEIFNAPLADDGSPAE